MTKREILCALKSFITNPEVEFEKYFEDLTVEEAEAFIENEIELLDKRAASAKEAAAKKKAQGDELTEHNDRYLAPLVLLCGAAYQGVLKLAWLVPRIRTCKCRRLERRYCICV